jgi:M6 family metalloprotease-like protein
MVQFRKEEPDNPRTTGDGLFNLERTWPDSFPHDISYFRRQLFHVETYWDEVSYSQFSPSITLLDTVITLNREMAAYGADDSLEVRTLRLLRDTVESIDPFTEFREGNRIIVIHAGAGQESDIGDDYLGDTPDDIWSTYVPLCDIQEHLGLESGIPTDDGVFIQEGIIVPETENQDDPYQQSRYAIFGITVHLFAHLLGLPSLYDTTPDEVADSQGIGRWGLMGYGAWNGNGFSPPHPCAWCKADLQWVNVMNAALDGTANTLYMVEKPDSLASSNRGSVIRIDLDEKEYFLLENRLQDENGNGAFDFYDDDGNGIFEFFDPGSGDSYTGAEFDYFLPDTGTGSGLLIWHMDEDVIAAGRAPCTNRVNADPFRKGVDLEEADGVQDLDSYPVEMSDYGSPYDSFRLPYNTTFGPYTSPGTHFNNGALSNLEIYEMGYAGKVMTFKARQELYQSGWPVAVEGTFYTNSLHFLDIDGGGTLEVVAASYDSLSGRIWVWHGDGTPFLSSQEEGEPFTVVESPIRSTPATGDIDGDGLFDVVAGSDGGRVWAFHYRDADNDGRGDPAAGWPCEVDGIVRSSPVLWDIDDDSADEIFIVSTDYENEMSRLYGFRGDGALISADYPLMVSGICEATPAIIESQDGEIMVLMGAAKSSGGTLKAVRAGDARQLWSVDVDGFFSASPVVGDLDADTMEEVVVVFRDGTVSVWDEMGNPEQGWPRRLEGEFKASPALADFDDDGYLEIILASYNPEVITVLKHNGGFLPDWTPIRIYSRESSLNYLYASPVVGDLNGDGKEDILVVTWDGLLRAYGRDGLLLAGWPLWAALSINATPVLGDVDRDGDTEIAVAGYDSYVKMWDLTGTWSDRAPSWPAFMADTKHSGRFQGLRGEVSMEGGALISEGRAFNCPNPVREGHTDIYYWLNRPCRRVDMHIYNVTGELVYAPPEGSLKCFAGLYNLFRWDVSGVANGVYLCRIHATGEDGEEGTVFFKIAVAKE